jgi:chromosomal replication initiator protein
MLEPDGVVWRDMLAHLRTHAPTVHRQWFEDLVSSGIHHGVLWVLAPTAIERDYLQSSCTQAFQDAAQAITGHLVAVRFALPGEQPSALPLNGALAGMTPKRIAKPLADSLPLNPDCSFENFVIGPSNRLAHAFATAVATKPGLTYNPFFIHANVGLGKTHLLQAICLRMLERHPEIRLLYISCGELMNRFIASVQSSQMYDFRNRFEDIDVVVVDDIHYIGRNDTSQEVFFHTFNALMTGQRQVILSSDAAPDEIPALEERLVSRFKAGLVSNLGPPDFETRKNIVLRKAANRGLELPSEVATFIAERIESNVRELEGAINNLQMRAWAEDTPISLAMAEAELGKADPKGLMPISVPSILELVSQHFDVKITDLQSKKRSRSISGPRHIAMFLARRLTTFSLVDIGFQIGGRDHTTIIHGVDQVEHACAHDETYRATVEKLEKIIKDRHGL